VFPVRYELNLYIICRKNSGATRSSHHPNTRKCKLLVVYCVKVVQNCSSCLNVCAAYLYLKYGQKRALLVHRRLVNLKEALLYAGSLLDLVFDAENVPPKRRLSFNGLHGFVSRKIEHLCYYESPCIRPSCVEAGSNTSTVALRAVGGYEKGTQCLGVLLGHTLPGGYKYGDLVLQVWGVSNLRQ
jgi:hypothetical protein